MKRGAIAVGRDFFRRINLHYAGSRISLEIDRISERSAHLPSHLEIINMIGFKRG